MLHAPVTWSTDDIPDLRGRRAVVTGASSGLGQEVAEQLALHGARVVLAVRDPAKGERVRRALLDRDPSADVAVAELDLMDLDSVRRFAAAQAADGRRLHLLVNNAGITPERRVLSPQGLESAWATNVVGHFLLTALLLEALDPGARIVHVGSGLFKHLRGGLPLDDPAMADGFSVGRAYIGSKLAVMLFGDELDRRLQAGGSSVRSLIAHPGMASTPGNRDRTRLVERMLLPVMRLALARSVAEGALPLLYAATAPQAPAGVFLGPGWRKGDLRVHAEPLRPPADDRALARRLWAALERQSGTVLDPAQVAAA